MQPAVADAIGYTVDEKGCWIAKRTIGPGYPFFPVSGRPEGMTHYSQYAHRAVLEEKLGRVLTPEELACHTCDVRRCMNPNHLYKGDRKSNMKDLLQRHPEHKEKLKKTEEQKAVLSAATSAYFSALSDEQRKELSEKAKTYNKKSWDSRTREQRENHREACSRAAVKRYGG